MRLFDTRRIIDSNKGLLAELYVTRQEDYPTRAAQEIRTWHLPITSTMTVRATNEQSLLYPPTPSTQPTKHVPCATCNKIKPLYGEKHIACLSCWDIYLRTLWGKTHQRGGATHAQNTALLTGEPSLASTRQGLHLIANFTDFTQWAHTILKCTSQHIPLDPASDAAPPTWSSPKKNFLAAEVGCTICGRKAEVDWIYSEDTQDWGNGLCPTHCEFASPLAAFMWNMHPADYQAWQASYSTSRKLQRTAQRYGACSLLLVSPEYEWVKLLSLTLPIAPKVHHIQTGHLSSFTIGKIEGYSNHV